MQRIKELQMNYLSKLLGSGILAKKERKRWKKLQKNIYMGGKMVDILRAPYATKKSI